MTAFTLPIVLPKTNSPQPPFPGLGHCHPNGGGIRVHVPHPHPHQTGRDRHQQRYGHRSPCPSQSVSRPYPESVSKEATRPDRSCVMMPVQANPSIKSGLAHVSVLVRSCSGPFGPFWAHFWSLQPVLWSFSGCSVLCPVHPSSAHFSSCLTISLFPCHFGHFLVSWVLFCPFGSFPGHLGPCFVTLYCSLAVSAISGHFHVPRL